MATESAPERCGPKLARLRDALLHLRGLVRQRPIIKYRPHPLQAAFHRDLRTWVLFCGANRIGKTKALAAELYWCISGEHPFKKPFEPPFSIYVVSALMEKLLYEDEQLFSLLKSYFPKNHRIQLRKAPDTTSTYFAERDGGLITIHFKSENMDVAQAAGGNPALIIIDEEIKHTFWKELNIRLLSRPDSQMLIGATPAVEDGGGITWMHEQFLEGRDLEANNDPNVGIHKGSVYDNPYLDDDRIQQMIAETPEEDLRARIYGDLTPRAKLPVFSLTALDQIWKRRLAMDVTPRYYTLDYTAGSGDPRLVETNTGELVLYRHPIDNHAYAIGIDTIRGGSKQDYAVIQVVDRNSMEQVARWRGRVDSYRVADLAAGLGLYFNTACIAPEMADEGYTVATLLRVQHAYPNLYRGTVSTKPDSSGWEGQIGYVPNEGNKRQIVDSLDLAIAQHILYVYDRLTIDELRHFERKETGKRNTKMGAPPGMYDDCVIALAIAIHIALTGDTHMIYRGARGKTLGGPFASPPEKIRRHPTLGVVY